MTGSAAPRLLGVYLFVRDLDASVAFYRCAGLGVERISDMFARATLADGASLEMGTTELTRSYDPAWQPAHGPGLNTINLELSSRDAVDATYRALLQAGYRGHLAPCDPPWQARFAIVDDPDGNPVGLHSPRDRIAESRRERG